MPVAQQWGNTRDDVAFFAASGLAALAPLHQIPGDRSMPVSGVTALDRAETPIGALILPHAAAAEAEDNGSAGQPSFVTLATRGGRIKRVTVKDLASAASRGVVTVINVEEGDQLGWVALSGGQDEIVLVTRQGRAIRFSEEEVRPMGLSAAGVLSIKLGRDDAVVGMGLVHKKDCLVTVSELGFAKRTAIADFSPQKRYGGGIQAANVTAKTGRLAVAALAGEDQALALMLAKGQVITVPVKAVPPMGRAATGKKGRQDTKEDLFDPPTHGLPLMLAVLAAAPAPSAKGPSPETEDKGPAAPRRTRAAKVELAAEEPASSRTKKAAPALKAVTMDKPAPSRAKQATATPKPSAQAPKKDEPAPSRAKQATTALKPPAQALKEEKPAPSQAKQPAPKPGAKALKAEQPALPAFMTTAQPTSTGKPAKTKAEQPALPPFTTAKPATTTPKPAAKTPKAEEPAPSRAKPAAKTLKAEEPVPSRAKQPATKPAKTPKKEEPAPSRAKQPTPKAEAAQDKQPPASRAKQVIIKPEPTDQVLDLDTPAYLRRKPARPAQEPAQEPPSPWLQALGQARRQDPPAG